MLAEGNILSVSGLTISFGNAADAFIAVKNISFNIAPNRTLAIVGESGSGKSLTALALMNLLPATAEVSGNIIFGMEDVKRGKDVAMIFQEPMSALNPVMKIGRQLTECILCHQPVSKQQAKVMAAQWLQKVQLSPALYHRYPHQLSGGQKQRVMIAMAMCNHPALLIADEPTTALDVTVQKEILALIHQLQTEQGTAMIFITHDLGLASETADDIMVMLKGEVVEYGNVQKVLHQPSHPYTKALLECRPTTDKKGKVLPIVSDFLSNTNPSTKNLPLALPSANVLLQVNNLKVWFGENENWRGKPRSWFRAVDEVSFELKHGESLGLVGESGCGKSTLSRSLMGLLPVTAGQILFDGKDLANISEAAWKQVRSKMQMIFQDPFASLNPRITVGDMLKEVMAVHNIVPAKDLNDEVQHLLNIVHLPAGSQGRYPHQFSGGQRQRLGIARALALKPQILICDESVSALDVSVQAQVLNLLKELQHELNLSYLFISHDLAVVHYMCDRVMVMQAGKIVESGEATEILSTPQNPYTQKLVAAIPIIK